MLVAKKDDSDCFYRIQFRQDGQHFTAVGSPPRLAVGTFAMVVTDHGLEPARIVDILPPSYKSKKHHASYTIKRLAKVVELEKIAKVIKNEEDASIVCRSLVEKHQLEMCLVRVERFFNGSKTIFYFTADSRVDFRELVKDLVRECRTRIEMRQIGARHETKMIGGIGTCGRQLCCSSFIQKFGFVSIKMVKEQDLPLNPGKISGICNCLLCCLSYEHETYSKRRSNMPKLGKLITIGDEQYRVKRQMLLQNTILAENSGGEEIVLTKGEWNVGQSTKKENLSRKE